MPLSDNSNELAHIARDITEHHCGAPVLDLTPIIGSGTVNAVYRLQLPERQVVLRLRAVALGEYQKEAWCIAQTTALGVSGPEVIACGEADGVAYLLESCLPGTPGDECTCELRPIWQALGRYARQIHSIPSWDFDGERAGDAFGDAAESFAPTWQAHVSYNIDSITPDDEVLAMGVYRANQADRIRTIFSSLLTHPFRFGLTHGDLSLSNCLVTEAGEVAIVDWGCARIHVTPHYELNVILEDSLRQRPDGPELLAAFLDGYGISPAAFAAMQAELKMLLLLSAVDTLRWAIDRCPSRISELCAYATEVAARVLS